MESNLSSFIDTIFSAGVYKIIISNPLSADVKFYKISFSRVQNNFLCELLTKTQAFHQNITLEEAEAYIQKAFADYKQINAWSREKTFSAKKTKKGRLLFAENKTTSAPSNMHEHNYEKKYLIQENCIVPPLVDMGIMTEKGQIISSMYNKFRQINRYLEIIDDIVKNDDSKVFHILDLGCGKSYLTFVVYYYFTEIKNIPITMVGVDLKDDVIVFCKKVAEKYGYTGLSFEKCNIAEYKSSTKPDMIISLHACDVATDFVLHNAIQEDVKYILSAPCCHHEINAEIDMSVLPSLNEYGIVNERFSALITDAIRTDILLSCGYTTAMLEFVDITHTPKNILIRAVKSNVSKQKKDAALRRVKETCKQIGVYPKLYKLLNL